MRLLLDTNVLGYFCHPSNQLFQAQTKVFLEKYKRNENIIVFIPEIADYELRRELLRFAQRNNQTTSRSIQRLDNLVNFPDFEYLPIDTNHWRKAAELWAQARNLGQPIAADKELGGDVILAAQALAVGGTVVTTNVKHLCRFVSTKEWNELIAEWSI
jgi:predicted nucleic acid-binding protein